MKEKLLLSLRPIWVGLARQTLSQAVLILMNSSEESDLNKIDKELLEHENEFLDSALNYFKGVHNPKLDNG